MCVGWGVSECESDVQLGRESVERRWGLQRVSPIPLRAGKKL